MSAATQRRREAVEFVLGPHVVADDGIRLDNRVQPRTLKGQALQPARDGFAPESVIPRPIVIEHCPAT